MDLVTAGDSSFKPAGSLPAQASSEMSGALLHNPSSHPSSPEVSTDFASSLLATEKSAGYTSQLGHPAAGASNEERSPNRPPGGWLTHDIHGTHHFVVLMFQDVAMPHVTVALT